MLNIAILFVTLIINSTYARGPRRIGPTLEWDFRKASNGDSIVPNSIILNSKYNLNVVGPAQIQNGALNCNGGYAESVENLDSSMGAHSLEVVIKLDELNQHGSGAISIDSNYNDAGGYIHSQFDAIVYNFFRWTFGSESPRRTNKILDGEAETVKNDWIHVVAVYDGNGLQTMYRNGELYGNPFTTENNHVMDIRASPTAGYRILFCRRDHGAASLGGSIQRGAVYKIALTAEEVSKLYSRNTQLNNDQSDGWVCGCDSE